MKLTIVIADSRKISEIENSPKPSLLLWTTLATLPDTSDLKDVYKTNKVRVLTVEALIVVSEVCTYLLSTK